MHINCETPLETYLKMINLIRLRGTPRENTQEVIGLSILVRRPQRRLISRLCCKIDLPAAFLGALLATSGTSAPQGSIVRDPLVKHPHEIYCGYGSRLRGDINGVDIDQIEAIQKRIEEDPLTRRAVASIFLPFDHDPHSPSYKHPPCPVSLQFLVRDDYLDMIVYMRSQSVIVLFPYDLFILTFIQESLATSMNIKMGQYHQYIGSAHYYNPEKEVVNQILNTKDKALGEYCLPPMPSRDLLPFEAATYITEEILAKAEGNTWKRLRSRLLALPSYWMHVAAVAMLALPIEEQKKKETVKMIPSHYRKLL